MVEKTIESALESAIADLQWVKAELAKRSAGNTGGQLMAVEMKGLGKNAFSRQAIMAASASSQETSRHFITVGNLVEMEFGVGFPHNLARQGEKIDIASYTTMWVHPFLRVAVKAADLFYYPKERVTAAVAFEESVKYWRRAIGTAKEKGLTVNSLLSLEKLAVSAVSKDIKKRTEGE